MWNFMEATHEASLARKQPGVFVKTTDEGLSRVMKGNYAFLMESTMIDYNIQRNCELMQVGGLLDSNGYGIGTQIGESCGTFDAGRRVARFQGVRNWDSDR